MLHFLIVPVVLTTILADEKLRGPDFWNGERLLENCTSLRNDDYAACIGYLYGVADKVTASRARAKKPQCIPTGTSSRDITVDFLHAHPELRPYVASDVVTFAIHGKWCPDPKEVIP
jgi:hypothetical protein